MAPDYGYLNVVRNEVAPWFETYGATLDDAPSFRSMILMAQTDVAKTQAAFEGVTDKALRDEIARSVRLANELIARMETRLKEIVDGLRL